MRLLLDTHAFIWWVFDDQLLKATARDVIEADANDVFVSAVSVYEIARKHSLGKWSDVELIARNISASITIEGFSELTVTARHAQAAGDLPGPHRDPFDRLLIAQALVEGMSIVSNERAFDAYGVSRIW